MDMDVVIFGGGAAGLWLLDDLTRRGQQAVLLEADALGAGQTVATQGIIHGGLKYTLQGLLTNSATSIREMPALWRECLNGYREPNLRAVRRRSDECFLWRTDSLSSRLGMLGCSSDCESLRKRCRRTTDRRFCVAVPVPSLGCRSK